jgi:putative sterol carrier protein
MTRTNSPQEIFDAMASRSLPEQAADINATIQFDLSGQGGGQWYAVVANGSFNIQPGTTPNPSLLFSASAADFVSVANGELNPVNAFMQGRVRIKGDMALAMRLQSLFRGG